MQTQDSKIDFFISQLSIDENKELVFSKVRDFFRNDELDKHIIFKRSILYFYAGSEIIDTYACPPTELNHSITFDGSKVSKIEKAYFVGAASKSMFDVEFEISSNNNNNNNNNNGNNNG